MPNYLSAISWEWEDRSQKSTGKGRRKRAPEKCKVYKYQSQNPQVQIKREIKGKTQEGCRRTGCFKSIQWFGVFLQVKLPQREPQGERTQLFILSTGTLQPVRYTRLPGEKDLRGEQDFVALVALLFLKQSETESSPETPSTGNSA